MRAATATGEVREDAEDAGSVPLLIPFRGRAGEVLDVAAVLLAILAAASLTVGADMPGRRYIALAFFCFTPGWVLLRRLGASAGSYVLLASIALSMAITMLTSQALLATGWSWRRPSLALTVVVAAVGFRTLRRPGERARVARPPLTREERLLLVLLVVGTAIALVGIAGADVGRVDDTGLYPALPPAYFAGVLTLVAGLYLTILRAPARLSLLACGYLAALLVVLHGLPGLLQDHPRFPVAWLHAGFTDVIAETGDLLPNRDARFSWASMFTGAALVDKVGGADRALWMVRFAPVLLNALAAAAIFQLGRAVRLSPKQVWGAVGLFVLANWVGQDYFAPQAVAFFLAILVLATALGLFPGTGLVRAPDWMRFLRAAPVPAVPRAALRVRLIAYGGVVIVVAATISGHQLTPVMLAVVLLGLALTGDTRLRALAFAIGLGAVAWLSFAAEDFWLGHLDRITGTAGQVGAVIDANVNQRAASGSEGRGLLIQARIGMGTIIWALSLLALAMGWRARRTPLALACMFFGPFSLVLLQSYGGEVLLRVQLYTLPASMLLIAALALRERMSWWRVLLPIPFLVALLPGFLLARYGNEHYEQVNDHDYAVLEALYETVPDGSTIFISNTQVPQYSQRVEGVRFRHMATARVPEIQRITEVVPLGFSYVLLTESQAAYAQAVRGRPGDWLPALTEGLLATGDFEVLAQSRDSVLLERVR